MLFFFVGVQCTYSKDSLFPLGDLRGGCFLFGLKAIW